ncbi:hypothetical protein M2459_000376 [Parabacteroides sp. PF5-5]|uniref:DUF6078 family protein n=1 Tax=unclassified Parabacteroides TaxID=2649774 RepID=UPI002476B4D5|nr:MULTISPECIES: DUF6078 family protein [unclassified Parabacteroides]MDH6306389.1 hypothetical protein [Parabacteroides sp. PH5-39]MDH6314661.1 hypothetical protein [Parabacteroides sp. PF5-13]MDH6321100.1 hypothetical protein [Parabacteroides sp. PH5-13]MDH6324832.1 hypothetical protein [Parabacteroides sp. PH5-8]MDH6325487.1 hypothetical protein [Parabacteroides sp. PH5-41]
MKENFNYKDVPWDYLHCLNAQCPRSADCLRFQVTLHTDQDRSSFSIVNPAYVAAREECPFFHLDRLTHFALGMRRLFDKVPHAKALKIRNILYHHFERSMYYRIRNKVRLITPKEQAFIRQVFLNEGIQEEPVFDEYVDQYDW